MGLVSLDAPLISNLNVLENIALIKECHEHISRRKAEDMARKHLHKLGLDPLAEKRNPALVENERFCVKVLRAIMVSEATLVLDRPFKMMPDLADSRFVCQILKDVDEGFLECYIFDYLWNEKRYTGEPDHES